METTERALVRRKQGRIVAGVAGGLADYTGTEPRWWRWGFAGLGALGLLGFLIVQWLIGGRLSMYSNGSATWWRLGFLLLLFGGGLAEWVYLALWFLVPRADLPRPAGMRIADRFTGGQTRVGLAALVFGAGLLGLWLGLWGAVVVWASLLVGVGLAIFRRTDGPDPAAVAAAIPPAGSTWDPAGPDAAPSGADSGTAPPAARRRRERRPKRPRSKLGWLFLGLALATGGVLWMLDASGSAHLGGSQLLAAVVLVLGVGLLVGAFVGRAKWTVLLGLPLIPILVLASAIGMPLIGRYEGVSVAPTNAGALKPSYVRTGGSLRFDLTRLPKASRPAAVHAELGVGQISVTTNPCVPVEITAHANLGSIHFSDYVGTKGSTVAGPNVSDAFHMKGPDPVRLDLSVGLGSIDVVELTVSKKEKAACTR